MPRETCTVLLKPLSSLAYESTHCKLQWKIFGTLSLFVLIQQFQVFVPLESDISMTRPHRTLSVGVSNQGYLSSLNQNTLCFHLCLICKHFSLPPFIDPDFADLGWVCSVSEVSWQVGGRTKMGQWASSHLLRVVPHHHPAASSPGLTAGGVQGGGRTSKKEQSVQGLSRPGIGTTACHFHPSIHLEQSKP